MKTIYLILLLSLITVVHASNPDDSTYPTAERLFHIARSLNKNLVCYDVNLENGKLNTKSPLNIYWVNREERVGETNGLSYFQRKMAYGYKLVSEGDDTSEVTLTAYSGKKLTIYVKGKPNNPLGVEYVELQGTAINTGVKVTERVKK